MRKRSNIALMVIGILLVSIPILGFITLKPGNNGYPNFFHLFNNNTNQTDASSRFAIQVTYDMNGKVTKSATDSVAH